MPYNPDPEADAYERLFSRRDGDIIFSVPNVNVKAKVSEEEYSFVRLRVERMIPLRRFFVISINFLALFPIFYLVYNGYNFLVAIPIFVLSFVICYVISSLLMGSAVSPLVRLLREEWVARDDTPIPTALLGPVDVIKAESGKIAICILLGAVLLVKTILAR